MQDKSKITGKIIFFGSLHIGQKNYRFCTCPEIQLQDDDGNLYLYDLSFDFEEWSDEALPFMDGLPNRTIGLTLEMGDEIEYISSLGVELNRGYMNIYKGYEGITRFEDLNWLFYGKISEVMMTHDGTLAFNLYNDEIDKTKLIDDDSVISTENFSSFTIPDGSLGKPYPLIIGSPGYGFTSSIGNCQSGGQAINLHFDSDGSTLGSDLRYMIAGHRLGATSVYVRSSNEAEIPNGTYNIDTSTDDNGILYSYIDFTGVDTATESTEIYFGFTELNAGFSGVSGAGDFLTAFMPRTTMRFNWKKIFSIKSALDQYKIDTQILESSECWEWIFQNVLSFLPISYLEDGEGLYFILWDFSKTPVVTLEVDENIYTIEDAGPQFSALDEVYNRLTIRGAKNAKSNSYSRIAKVSGNPDSNYSDPRLIRSRALVGDKFFEVSLDHIADENTIYLILQNHIRRYGLPYQILQYESDIYLDYLEIGDCVHVIDDRLSIDADVFVIAKSSRAESLAFKFIYFYT